MSLNDQASGRVSTDAQAPFVAKVHDASRETFNEVSIEGCKVSLLHVQQADANLHEAKLSEPSPSRCPGSQKCGASKPTVPRARRTGRCRKPPSRRPNPRRLGDARRCRNERLTARGRSEYFSSPEE